VLEILRAHARADPALPLLVIGDTERAGRYGALCRAAASREVRFLGALFDRRTLFSLRRECAAVLHGHSVGGTNPALLEAMAAAAPVIAHENSFTREVLGDGALTFRGEDELVRLLGLAAAWSAEERARAGATNRARVAARYTWERIASEYAALLGSDRPSSDSGRSPALDAVPAPFSRAAERRDARKEVAS
jgi:glycosyltransferase involved in cell wall biosynthesis